MTKANLTVKVSLSGLKKFTNGIFTGSSAAIAKTLKQWGVRYRSFAQQRFDHYSKGGGNWPPLAESTIARRKGSGENVAILRDTGTLFRALDPVFQSNPGAIEEINPAEFSTTVGFGGPHKHPSAKGDVTVADIARFHNFGMGNNPRRQIIVAPDADTLRAMARDAQRNLQQELNESVGGK